MKNSGFTLIELLLTISILSILGTVAVATLFGALASARDGKRMAEISLLAKSIEVTKDHITGIYQYDSNTLRKDYPNGIPADPFASKGRRYCISVNRSGKVPPAECGTNWESECPASCSNVSYASIEEAVADFNSGPVLSWTICASMEKKDTPFCEKSLQR